MRVAAVLLLMASPSMQFMVPTRLPASRVLASRVGALYMQEGGDGGARESEKRRGKAAVISRPKPKPVQKNKEDVDKEPQWRVLLHNDDVHTWDYVSGCCFARAQLSCPWPHLAARASSRLASPCLASPAPHLPCPTPPPVGGLRSCPPRRTDSPLRIGAPGHLCDRLGGQDGHAQEGSPHHDAGAHDGNRHRDRLVEAAGEAVLPQASAVWPDVVDNARVSACRARGRSSWEGATRGRGHNSRPGARARAGDTRALAAVRTGRRAGQNILRGPPPGASTLRRRVGS